MRSITKLSAAALISAASILASTANSNAALIAAIGNDPLLAGGDDIIVVDNGAGDTIGALGAISFATSAYGYSLLVNVSQSKPIIGSAALPALDVTFVATTGSNVPSTVYLFLSDTDFVGAGPFTLALGGTNSGGSGTITGTSFGGTSNVALDFSTLLGVTSPVGGVTFSDTVGGVLTPTAFPYSLSAGVAITRSTPGTTTGDLNLTVVPEPSTFAALAPLGTLLLRRRRTA